LELIERFPYDDYSPPKYLLVGDDGDGVFTYIMDGEQLAKDGYLLDEGIQVRVERENSVIQTYILHHDLSKISFERTEHTNEVIAVYGKTQRKLLHTLHPRLL
jgi:hypothetical protein